MSDRFFLELLLFGSRSVRPRIASNDSRRILGCVDLTKIENFPPATSDLVIKIIPEGVCLLRESGHLRGISFNPMSARE